MNKEILNKLNINNPHLKIFEQTLNEIKEFKYYFDEIKLKEYYPLFMDNDIFCFTDFYKEFKSFNDLNGYLIINENDCKLIFYNLPKFKN